MSRHRGHIDIEIELFHSDYEEQGSTYDVEPPDFGVVPIGPWG
jgi:hypothetical protein